MTHLTTMCDLGWATQTIIHLKLTSSMSPLTFPFLLKSHLTTLWLCPLLITFPPWSSRTQPFWTCSYLAGRWFSLFFSSLLASGIWLQYSSMGYFSYLGLNPFPWAASSKSRLKSQTLILRPRTPDGSSPWNKPWRPKSNRLQRS